MTDAQMDALLASLGGASLEPGRPARPGAQARRAEVVNYGMTYYPGVAAFAQALRLTLAPGEEKLGLDMTLSLGHASAIAGSVGLDGAGVPGSIQLSLITDGPRALEAGNLPILSEPPGADGRFRYTSVVAGHYTILARANVDVPGAGTVPWFATAEVEVSSDDVSGVVLMLRPGVSVSGLVRFDSGSSPPARLSGIRVGLSVPGGGYLMNLSGTGFGNVLFSPRPSVTDPGGTFRLTTVAPGTYRLDATIPGIPSAIGGFVRRCWTDATCWTSR